MERGAYDATVLIEIVQLTQIERHAGDENTEKKGPGRRRKEEMSRVRD